MSNKLGVGVGVGDASIVAVAAGTSPVEVGSWDPLGVPLQETNINRTTSRNMCLINGFICKVLFLDREICLTVI
jgi:hypothetical protein